MSTQPAGYQAPKTNWQAADVPLPADVNRMEGNINAIESGDRTLDPAQAPTGIVGTLRQLLDWFANRIAALTGAPAADWWKSPPTTLTAAKAHFDATAPHVGHETPVGAQGKVDTHALVKTSHVPAGKYVAYSSRADQAPDWSDIASKPAAFTPTAHAASHKTGGADALVPGDIGAAGTGLANTFTQRQTFNAGITDGDSNDDISFLRAFGMPVDTRSWVATAWNADSKPITLELRNGATVVATIQRVYTNGKLTSQTVTAGGKTRTSTVTWDGEKFVQLVPEVT